jgi:hypothetical protein
VAPPLPVVPLPDEPPVIDVSPDRVPLWLEPSLEQPMRAKQATLAVPTTIEIKFVVRIGQRSFRERVSCALPKAKAIINNRRSPNVRRANSKTLGADFLLRSNWLRVL